MPLLHRKPFVRQKPPADLKPDEEVFLCKVTHEIFRTYDDFFERTILCNSLVWSCAVTGKPGLTYLEALDCEKRGRQSLQSFPSALVVPLLHLTALTYRTRLHEICDDVYSYVKERFFPGEIVDVVTRSGTRQLCEILDVQSPHHSNGPVNGHAKLQMEGDFIVISDSEEDTPKSPKSKANGKTRKSVNPSVFKYKVRPIKEGSVPIFTKAGQMSRKKNTFSRDRLKLLLKQHCEPQNGVVMIKASTVAKYKLAEQHFSQFFPDQPPVFVFSPPPKGRSRPKNDSSPREAAEEKLRLMQQKEEMIATAHEKANREREDDLGAKKKEKEDKDKKREAMKNMFEEEKQRRKDEKERMKVEKEKEREKLKEEKKKYAERLKIWSKPREDMECDDLKDLPAPVPVETRLPAELFGDALMVLEFLKAFGELFDLKDEFPEGLTLEVLEEALVGSDPEGPLCELLFFFLSAIFQALAEEQEEVARDQVAEVEAKDLSEALDDDADPTHSAISAVASLAAAWPQLYQGCSLKQLDLDSCTLSEILRLHILASGADCNSANAKFRYQKRGGFGSTDDPCVELRLANPGLLKRLSCTAVYDLLPGEKLKILHALCGKLLTLVSTRDFIEDSADEQRQAKQELRELKAEQHRREREEAAIRVRKRKEEKLKEQEMKLKELKEKHEKLMEGRNSDMNTEEMNTSTESLKEEHQTEDEEEQAINRTRKMMGSNLQEKQPKEVSAEQQPREKDLQERIQKVAACTYILPLGRDRLYRRYWLFPSTSALFVEDDYFGLTEDMLDPQEPTSEQEPAKAEEMEVSQNEAGQPEDLSQTGSTPDPDSKPIIPAPVQSSSAPPVNRPNHWAFYSSPQEVEALIEALNPRGHRESTLKEVLVQEKERIAQLLCIATADRYHQTDIKPEAGVNKAVSAKSKAASALLPEGTAAPAEDFMCNRLRDLLLDIEDRIYQGTLGQVKVMERSVWRKALEEGHYELLTPELKENGVTKRENCDVENMEIHYLKKDRLQVSLFRLQELKGESMSTTSTSPNTPQMVNNTVHYLAQALAHIQQGIERKFLKAPLGDEDSKKDQKAKKKEKKDEDQHSEEGSDSGRLVKTVQERWRESLLGCSSMSQVFLHLSTLERSVIWAKSLLNARCKVCRRKGDAENMLLCDCCDRGHHIHCVRPKLKAVPEGDWFCPECRPKQRANRLPSRQRSSVNSEELEEEDSGEETMEEEKSAAKKVRTAVKPPVPTTKGSRSSRTNSSHSTPRSQQTTPKQAPSAGKGAASRSSGKKPTPVSNKPTPVSNKPTPVSNGRPPPRPGSRVSSRLSHEILATNGTSSRPGSQPTPSLSLADSRKRPISAEVSHKPRLVLTPSVSGSSSNRRSSGRNLGVHELSACEQLTVELVRHEDSWPFMKLVSRTQVPDYFDIIKKPIALSTIREKVNNCAYKTATAYVEDVELMFANCLQYNPQHTNEAKAGTRLQAFFNSEIFNLGLADRTTPPLKRSRM
ncbi:bromodomain adjacent to zinc finger domain protein 1A isoform X1 [Oncorhynchus tshawytscha]|uniref:bromodomain adjacent to zinc finger domain protein 1A isoform X1 n=1 Tax=Oncorhynchus tshawytscha TaxID=74940 RepID=UPI000D09A988|nr:bromodomain adjacent to zinc finger domain protein 1A isoform X1 [Oncorhynchus tshawytscha]XP_024286153.1 bromodomain adjacent to zinc finger domain protein 1A isoform X1 [Oncorhynchus tshawytscha]XP_024286154.1 bromodomain adjacent to zinc finger domain protein 1A isoform X1 [Oncorhynchus tshawytscha]